MSASLKKSRSSTWKFAGLALTLLLGSGCASQQKLKGYETEIVSLREEKTKLRKENQELKRRIGDYEVSLSDANMRLQEAQNMTVQPVEIGRYPELDSLGVTYGERAGNLVITLPNDITFGSGKATLSANGKKALMAVANTLRSDYPGEVYFIEGHTDTDPIKKSKFKSNRELSVVRAMEVHQFLVEECSIDDQSCVVAGYGEYRPVTTNDSKDGKAKNRRVEIVVHLAEA